MNHLTEIRFACLLLQGLLLVAGVTHAQDPPQEPTEQNEIKPKPAARSLPTIDANVQPEDTNKSLQPDITPLTGAQTATLGSTEIRHSYWVPGIQFATNVQSGGSGQSWFADNYLIGNISLLKAWSRSQLAVNYSGGGFFSTNDQQGNGYYQELALAQSFQWNRLTLQFLDQFSYLPQSQFGFGGGTNLGIPGVGGSVGPTIPSLGGNYVPNQSIYASLGPRYSNAGVVQATYALSPRGSITASGSYGILRFVDPGSVDNNTVIGSLGYNYVLNHEDTMGFFYRFSNYQYPGQPQAFADHTFGVAYSKRITGRVAFFVSGGPELTEFRIPVGNETSKLGANVGVTFTYALENGALSAGYQHGLTGGSGVFTGSTVDMVTFGLTHKLSRVWSGQLNLGYAQNRAVVNSTQSTYPNYNSWTIGGGVNRPFGRDFNFAAVYTANIGTFLQSGCVGSACTSHQTYNYITLNVQWHSRPLVLP